MSIIRNDHTSMYFLEGLLILRHEISNQICFWSEREFPDMTNGELSKLIGKFSASLEKNYQIRQARTLFLNLNCMTKKFDIQTKNRFDFVFGIFQRVLHSTHRQNESIMNGNGRAAVMPHIRGLINGRCCELIEFFLNIERAFEENF